ncbi:Hypothetical predicted protein [Mytilus galloprovincialis]|uniref:Uncharacterized protein n=1 Tax=Mytilus galloprovincialis TaxID=29158 RepID=A0A8B6GYC7_MYTGA|nr:Hypothetical predicted protein [Mytilus galloprovincialis]
MNQSSFSQDTNFYCPNPNNMLPNHSQSQQMCSMPTTGMIIMPMQHVSHQMLSKQQRPQWVDELFSRLVRFENKETNLCSDVLLEFCSKYLKIENPAEKNTILDSFRLGKKAEKNRPILVNFANFEMRDLVKKSSKNLKDSLFGISEQLSLEIPKRRKEKLPLLKELRSRDI